MVKSWVSGGPVSLAASARANSRFWSKLPRRATETLTTPPTHLPRSAPRVPQADRVGRPSWWPVVFERLTKRLGGAGGSERCYAEKYTTNTEDLMLVNLILVLSLPAPSFLLPTM